MVFLRMPKLWDATLQLDKTLLPNRCPRLPNSRDSVRYWFITFSLRRIEVHIVGHTCRVVGVQDR